VDFICNTPTIYLKKWRNFPMAKVNIVDLNCVEEMRDLSEQELVAIQGGIDLVGPARRILGILGDTAGDAISVGLGELIF
jgi:hypothetical protein